MLAEKHALSDKEAERFLNLFFDVLNDGLHYEKAVKIKGLGTFKVTSVNSRESVNVNTGERIVIDGREKISFTPEAALRDRVNRPFAQFETVPVNDGADIEKIDEKFAASLKKDVAQEPVEEESNVAQKGVAAMAGLMTAGAVKAASETEKETFENAKEAEEKLSEPENVIEDEAEESVETKEELKELDEQEEMLIGEEERSDDGDDSDLPETEVEEPEEKVEEKVEEAEKVDKPKQEERTEEEVVAEEKAEPELQEVKTEESQKDEASNEHHHSESRKIRHLERENAYLIDTNEELENKLHSKNRLVKWLAAAICLLLLGGVVGAYYFTRQISNRNKTIEMLYAQQGLSEFGEQGQQRPEPPHGQMPPRQDGKPQAAPPKPDGKPMPKDAKPMPNAQKAAPQQPQTQQPTSAAPATDAAQYNKDPRVRLGAYTIEGVAQTVTVQKGQTLKGISKAHLGPGMECYIEAVNGGIKEVTPGQKINIPKLKMKKNIKKR